MDGKYNVSFFKPGNFVPIITCNYHIDLPATQEKKRLCTFAQLSNQPVSWEQHKAKKSCGSRAFFSSNISMMGFGMALGARWAALSCS